MIVRIDGREIECSVDEYRALFPDPKPITRIKSTTEKPTKKDKKPLNRWTKSEDKFLKQNILSGEKNYVEASEFLDRSETAVYTRCVRLGLVRALKKRKNKEAKSQKVVAIHKVDSVPVKKDKRGERMSWVQKKAKNYCETMGWNYNKAFTQACVDWKERGKGGSTKNDFPFFNTLKADSQEDFRNAMSHVVKNKRSFRQLDMNHVAMPSDEGESTDQWTDNKWLDFLNEFIIKSHKVASFFGVKDHFTVTKKHRTSYIVYGNGE